MNLVDKCEYWFNKSKRNQIITIIACIVLCLLAIMFVYLKVKDSVEPSLGEAVLTTIGNSQSDDGSNNLTAEEIKSITDEIVKYFSGSKFGTDYDEEQIRSLVTSLIGETGLSDERKQSLIDSLTETIKENCMSALQNMCDNIINNNNSLSQDQSDTKQSLSDLAASLGMSVDDLTALLNKYKSETNSTITNVSNNLTNQISTNKSDTDNAIDDVNSTVDSNKNSTDTSLKNTAAQIESNKTETDETITKNTNSINNTIAANKEETDNSINELDESTIKYEAWDDSTSTLYISGASN